MRDIIVDTRYDDWGGSEENGVSDLCYDPTYGVYKVRLELRYEKL